MTKPSYIARTGRVQDWMDDPEQRYPVSCTVFDVHDSCSDPEHRRRPQVHQCCPSRWRWCSHPPFEAPSEGSDNGKGLIAMAR